MGNKSMDEWWEERSIVEKIIAVIIMVSIVIGLIFLFGWIVMLLWNWLMPEIFGLPELSYWQAWGLLLLCTILFKNIDFGSDDSKSKRNERKRKRKLREYMRGQETEETDDVPTGDAVPPAPSAPDDALRHPPAQPES